MKKKVRLTKEEKAELEGELKVLEKAKGAASGLMMLPPYLSQVIFSRVGIEFKLKNPLDNEAAYKLLGNDLQSALKTFLSSYKKEFNTEIERKIKILEDKLK